MALLAGAVCMRCASVFFASNSLLGRRRQTRTAPHCGRGSLRMANQVATGAGSAFAYGTGAGGRLRMAYQEAMGADKAFAYGTGAEARSH